MAPTQTFATSTTRRRCFPHYTYLVVLYILSASLLLAKGFSVQKHSHQRKYVAHSRIIHYSSAVSSLAASAAASSKNEQRADKQNTKSKLARGGAPNKRTGLKWVIQSIERFAQDPKFSMDKPSPQLLHALYKLQRGKCECKCMDLIFIFMYLDINFNQLSVSLLNDSKNTARGG